MQIVIGKKRLNLDIHPHPDNNELLTVKFPYNKDLVAEMKVMDKPRDCFNGDTKTWIINNNRRNMFALDILQNGEKIHRYDLPIPEQVWDDNWSHQNDMQNAVLTRKQCIIAGEMRTGKTRPLLRILKETNPKIVWIVSTKSGCKSIVREQIKANLVPDGEVRLFSYQGFSIHMNKLLSMKETIGYPVDKDKGQIPSFVIFDEIQKLKTWTAGVTKNAMILSNWMYCVYGYDGYFMVGLSGTPAPKNPLDWWSICEIIQPGFIREPSLAKFKMRYAHTELKEGNYGNYINIKDWNKVELDKLRRRLKPLVFVFLKKDCLDLPDKQYEIVELTCSKELFRVAKTIARNEDNGLAARNKLRQLSDGFQYKYDEYDERTGTKKRIDSTFVGTPKLDQLTEDLLEIEDVGRVVIYAGYKGSIDIVTEHCVKAGWTVLQVDGRGYNVFGADDEAITSDLCLDEMDRSTDTGSIIKLAIVMNQDSGSTGMEFSSAPLFIYYSNTDKGESRMQSEDRGHSNNMDKNRGLLIKDYCVLPSDYKMREQLMLKKDLQNITMGEWKSLYDEMES